MYTNTGAAAHAATNWKRRTESQGWPSNSLPAFNDLRLSDSLDDRRECDLHTLPHMHTATRLA